jgi:hypothetical protein
MKNQELLTLLEKTESMINRSISGIEKIGVMQWVGLLRELNEAIEKVKRESKG